MAEEADLGAGLAHHQAGRLSEAESIYRCILEAQPDNGDALHLLGLIAHQSGHNEQALKLIQRAIKADPDQPVFHGNLAIVQQALGRVDLAEAACRRALELNPANAEAMNNLGMVLAQQDKNEEAEEILRQAIQAAPANAAAHNNMGRLLGGLGRDGEALAAYEAATQADPNLVSAHAGRGALLRRAGRLDEAETTCRQALKIHPRNLDGWINLGNVLREMSDFEGARAAYGEALAVQPDHLNAHINLGGVLSLMERTGESLEIFQIALRLDTASAAAHNGLGLTLLNAGRTGEAGDAFQAAIRADEDFVEAYYNLGGARHFTFDAPAIAHLEALLARDVMPGEERMKLHYILARQAEAESGWAKSFEHYRQSNELRRADLARTGFEYDPSAHEDLICTTAGTFNEDFFKARTGSGLPGEKPVFIIGMPRSGTSLVEQIAASHSAVHGAGELNWIQALSRKLGGLDESEIKSHAEAHLERLEKLDGTAGRIIDKMPFNYLHLGLIALMFPDARIIHCRRDGMDTGLSCYFNLFTDPLAWTTDLAQIGHYFRNYQSLMDHWRGVLPLPMLEVDYEALIAGPEQESRAIIEFFGLDWEAGCLDFHQSDRVVRTASKWQVREPIYNASVGRAAHYSDFLEPLAAELNRRRG